MKKQEFMKYLENVEREDLARYVLDHDDELCSEILETENFIKGISPAALAKAIKESDLTLEDDYVRSSIYYYDLTEADTKEDLVTDDEIDDFFDEVDPDEYDTVLIEIGA